METVIALLLIVLALGLAAKGGKRHKRRSYVSYSGSNDDVTILGAGDSIADHQHHHHHDAGIGVHHHH